MPGFRFPKPSWPAALAIVALGYVLVHDFFWSGGEDPRLETISPNVEAAKTRGVWVASVRAEPAEWALPGRTLRVASAWVEIRSHRSSRILSPGEQRLGGFNLCFTLAAGALEEPYFLVPGDEDASVDEASWPEGIVVYSTRVDSAGAVADLRLSLVSSWQEPRAKNIRFVPTPGP